MSLLSCAEPPHNKSIPDSWLLVKIGKDFRILQHSKCFDIPVKEMTPYKEYNYRCRTMPEEGSCILLAVADTWKYLFDNFEDLRDVYLKVIRKTGNPVLDSIEESENQETIIPAWQSHSDQLISQMKSELSKLTTQLDMVDNGNNEGNKSGSVSEVEEEVSDVFVEMKKEPIPENDTNSNDSDALPQDSQTHSEKVDNENNENK